MAEPSSFSSSGSKLAARAIGAGQAVTPVFPLPTPCAPSTITSAGRHSVGIAATAPAIGGEAVDTTGASPATSAIFWSSVIAATR